MAKRGVKTNSPSRSDKRVKKASETPVVVDRFSKLPDPVIQQILSFLPTVDIVRTSLLSKRWRHMWYSVPALCFNNRIPAFYSPRGQKLFYKFVDNCLKHRKRGMCSITDSVITSFELEMNYSEENNASLDKWLGFAVESKVKELGVFLFTQSDSDDNYYYCLPETVVNARHLTILELRGIEMSTSYTYSLPFLKTLLLVEVLVEDDVMDNLVLDCPSLEKLALRDCFNLFIAQFHSSSLKFLEIDYTNYVSVQVEAINLESFVLVDINGCTNQVNISTCKAIRNLSLSSVPCITDQSLEDLISKLPLLENLILSCCDMLKHIKISSQSLKSFNLINTTFCNGKEVKVTIELAPNLASFCYKGPMKFSISMESPNLLNGNFVIYEQHENYDANWYIGLMNFLLNLNCSWNIISLPVDSDEALILPEDLRRICRPPLLNCKHLKVMIRSKPIRESELRDTLFWISPSLETLSFDEFKLADAYE